MAKVGVLSRRFLTITFVIGDFQSFMIQSTGAGLLAKQDLASQSAGKWSVIGGLAVQLESFGLFILVSVVFYNRIRKFPTALFASGEVWWHKNLHTLFAVSILIMVRSVFRIAEYVQGQDEYLIRREIWLYIFNAALMFAVMLLFNIVNPSKINGATEDRSMASSQAVDIGGLNPN